MLDSLILEFRGLNYNLESSRDMEVKDTACNTWEGKKEEKGSI